jgi:hypothetical protein
MAEEAELIVMAYGKLHARYGGIVRATTLALAATARPLRCFGLNKDGSARHPLYLRKDAALLPFSIA